MRGRKRKRIKREKNIYIGTAKVKRELSLKRIHRLMGERNSSTSKFLFLGVSSRHELSSIHASPSMAFGHFRGPASTGAPLLKNQAAPSRSMIIPSSSLIRGSSLHRPGDRGALGFVLFQWAICRKGDIMGAPSSLHERPFPSSSSLVSIPLAVSQPIFPVDFF